MGNCHLRNDPECSYTISTSDFEFIKAIGKGSLGKVWKVVHKKSNIEVAIKEFNKSNIPSRVALYSIFQEKNVLSMLSHPFIVNINFAFQNKKKLFLGLDLKVGGDLRYHMLTYGLTENQIKFIISCIILALKYVHKNNIIHKDIKPENILLDHRGYAYLTDFGSSEILKPNNSYENSGSPGYMSPEVICNKDHSFVSDFFGLGVILYEVMFRTRPFKGKNRAEIKEDMISKKIKVRDEDLAEGWTHKSADFCSKLLKRDPEKRLGFKGIDELISHPWLSEIDFKSLSKFQAQPLYVPPKRDNFDSMYVNFISHKYKNKETFSESEFLGYSHFSLITK